MNNTSRNTSSQPSGLVYKCSCLLHIHTYIHTYIHRHIHGDLHRHQGTRHISLFCLVFSILLSTIMCVRRQQRLIFARAHTYTLTHKHFAYVARDCSLWRSKKATITYQSVFLSIAERRASMMTS
jgi:hypothetical protein